MQIHCTSMLPKKKDSSRSFPQQFCVWNHAGILCVLDINKNIYIQLQTSISIQIEISNFNSFSVIDCQIIVYRFAMAKNVTWTV